MSTSIVPSQKEHKNARSGLVAPAVVGSQSPAPSSAILLPTGSLPVSPPPSPSMVDCHKGEKFVCDVEAAIARQVNQLRGTRAPFRHEKRISFAARQWSVTQGQRGSIGHDGFPEQRSRLFSIEFGGMQGLSFMAENVAMSSDFDSSESAEEIAKMFTDMWWNSPGHRRNMLGDYTYIGVGIAEVGGAYYGTQIFAE